VRCRQLADLSLLTERNSKGARTINISLLRSEENLRSQNLAKKQEVGRLLHREKRFFPLFLDSGAQVT